MGRRYNSGQEATEFVLISILVFFSALMVVFIFGGKIANFFTNSSSAVQVAQSGSKAIDPATGQKYDNQNDNYFGPTKSNSTDSTDAVASAGGYSNLNVTTNADGSMSMVVGSQTITVNSQVQNLADAIFSSSTKTTATNGKMELMSEIAKMIETYKSEYPEGQVPISLNFGQAQVNYKDVEIDDQTIDPNVNGVAAASSATIQVGSHIVIIQNDQCNVNDTTCQKYYPNQTRKYEITLSPDKKSLEGTMTVSNAKGESKTLSVDTTNFTYNNNSLSALTTKISDKIGDMDSGEETDIVMNFNNSFKL